MKLFLVMPNNQYRSPYLENLKENKKYLEGIGWRSLLKGWHPLSYIFYADPKDIKKGWGKRPDISRGSNLFFPADLVDIVFPEKSVELEFLPVLIDGEDWWLLNCLKITKDYDPLQSKFYRRGGHQQIFMIEYAVIYDPTVDAVGLFTLEDSNRAWLFATESFVERIHKLGLKGVDFDEIGVLEPR